MQRQTLLLQTEVHLQPGLEVLKIELGEDIEARTLYDVSHNIAKIGTMKFMVKHANVVFIARVLRGHFLVIPLN